MADPSTHFFKFIAPGFKFDLSLPSSFLTQLNCGRCSKATLSRGRHEWSVDIDDGVFGDGWRRFVRENGVQEFDFIVFKHKGGMNFDFLVFDQSTCERQYPDISDEMEVEEPPTISDTIRTHMKEPKNLKKHKRNDYASQDQQKFQVKKETGSTIKKATSSTLKDHPYFISTLKPTCFKKFFLQLPLHFAKRSRLKTGEMIIVDDKDRSWKVQLNKKDERCFLLGCGLRAFLVANELKVGDALKFELIEKEKNKPPVVSFSCLTPIEEDGRRYLIGKLKSYNYLPQEFVTFNGLMNKKIMILKNAEDERLWTVELRNNKRGYYIAWKKFPVANGLKEGDCFKIEVVDNGKKPIVNFNLLAK
ncbi:B3 domain-containing protein REM8 isoform X2 [Lactuca sativa]|uniref:B3 domain-containing protein REM8 isoform X2 n=1 Tax=Lactuca sativa TaxID=4236 RepID=UPI000CD89AC3|nr:B3 domain-containing protein REM8 isoform X2 [Lactuca sativa]